MTVARIVKDKYVDLTGMGAKLYGARWNSPGSPVVYTSSCGALAALEYTAHVGGMIPRRLKLLWIDVPDTLGREEIAGVPSNPAQFRQYGDEWLARQKEPLLVVPSVLVPAQRNILINPQHPHAAVIRIQTEAPFVLDSRLLLQLL